jgi:uncharacterized protein (TIGR03435 family)
MKHVLVVLLSGFLGAALSMAEGPTFDVASVKISSPDARPPYLVTGGPGTSDPGRFHAPHVSMFTLLQRAFGVTTDRIQGLSGGPTVYYDIDAVVPPGATKEQFQKMMQNLLAERFHLVVRHETRNFPGYELVVDKGGPKFKEVTPDTVPAGPAQSFAEAPFGEDGFPAVAGPRVMGAGRSNAPGLSRTKYQEQTMADFVSNLGFLIGASQGKSVLDGFPQPHVVDKTGLTGIYTFILEFFNASTAARDAALRQRNAAPDSGSTLAASDPGGGPDIFTAIQKQLGLRLVKTADLPLDVIVVEGVDRTPTEN